ncbi:hypothetical protein GC173_04480 [bacterium]|nr:hypothetical protein [bacterium]
MRKEFTRLICATLCLPAALTAATFSVSSESELAGAITTANSNGESDTITIASGTITLTADLPTITGDGGNALTIEGAGMGVTIVEAGDLPQELGGTGTHNRRVFLANAATLVLRDLTVRRGRLAGTGVYGGNIRTTSSSNTTIERVEIAQGAIIDTSNTYAGGGLSSHGTLVVTDSLVHSNFTTSSVGSANFSGAGIHAGGTSFSMSRTTIRDNSTNSKSDAAGVWTDVATTIDQCTFSNNLAGTKSGGAIRTAGGTRVTNIRRSTFSGNTGILGGAIYAVGVTNLESCTITGNTASSAGGGICSLGSEAHTLRNCVIAGNTLTSSAANDLGQISTGNFVSQGNNLIGATATGLTVNNAQASDMIGTPSTPIDALLGPLQDNGGPTLTHALLAGSPAIDAGTDQLIAGGTMGNDQRGGARVINGTADMGAVERDTTAPVLLGVTVTDATAVGTASGEFTFTEENVIPTARIFARDYVNAGNWAEVSGTVDPEAGTWSATLPGDGAYYVTLQIEDFEGFSTAAPSGTAAVTEAASVVYNDAENSTFQWTNMDGDIDYVFPVTAALDVILRFSTGTTGATATISRTTGDVAPPLFGTGGLIDEYLTIAGTIPPTRTATITWNYDPASAASLVGDLDSVYQFEGGLLQNTYLVTPTSNTLVIGPVSGFSDWYAGDASAEVPAWNQFED